MRKSRPILFVSLLIAVFGAASWLLLSHPSEPTYQGKPLTYWLDNYAFHFESTNGLAAETNAINAVCEIGTNGIPTLLRLLDAKDSNFKLKLIQLAKKQRLINIKFRSAEMQHLEASAGFSWLRSQGQSALPALVQIYNQHRPGPYADSAGIAEIFGAMGPAAANAIPQLLPDATNTNPKLRFAVIQALGFIRARPDVVVPVLINSLRDPDEMVRGWAASGLRDFGPDAKSALPELTKALSDPSEYVSWQAGSALVAIDPDAAIKAGIEIPTLNPP